MVPYYPEFAPISLSMRAELYPHFLSLQSGISEFTFSNIFLFRHTYDYKLSKVDHGLYIIKGTKEGKSFFFCPWGLPSKKILLELFSCHDFLKNLNEEQATQERPLLESLGFVIYENRDAWDYLYLSHEMATLEGKKFHKKRNHINAFFAEYSNDFQHRLMTNSSKDKERALSILETWHAQKEDKADYLPSKEAILFQKELGLTGCLWDLQGHPFGYAQGEAVSAKKMFVIHFEKADPALRGAYQVIFQDWSSRLQAEYELINREQDLGNPGLRQSKESYRPVGFVRKFQVWPSSNLVS